MKTKKIIIISQVLFPSLLPRAHRTTELAKELSKKGCDVTVYALLGNYDYSLFTQETGVKVKNLGNSKLGLVNSDEHFGGNLLTKAFNHFCGRYLWTPDRELIPMVKRAICSENEIDCLITIAVPHVIHYAASKSRLDMVKRWIADCGDPFMLNPFSKHPKRFEKYERNWCEKCDYITVPVTEAIKGYYPEYAAKIRVIPQGFDFEGTKIAEYVRNDVPTFAYIGAVYPGNRDPKLLLEYLCSLKQNFKFIIYGASWHYFEPYKQFLGEKLVFGGRMPRERLIFELSKCDFLINLNNKSGVQIPSKLIDYYLSHRPIISISSDLTEFEKQNLIAFLNFDFTNKAVIPNVADYDIRNVACQFISLM